MDSQPIVGALAMAAFFGALAWALFYEKGGADGEAEQTPEPRSQRK